MQYWKVIQYGGYALVAIIVVLMFIAGAPSGSNSESTPMAPSSNDSAAFGAIK